MTAIAPALHPLVISEARYGTQEGGKWVLTAGLENPRETIDAFSEGKIGMKFWRKVDKLGNLREVEVDNEIKKYYITAGDDPNLLICHFLRFIEESEEFDTGLEKLEKEYMELKENIY
jgi:hypothetical protein